MNILTTAVARWLCVVTFGGFGLMHLTMGSDLTGYVPDFLPEDVFFVYLACSAAGRSILIRK